MSSVSNLILYIYFCRIKSERFVQLASDICKIFTNENPGSYYNKSKTVTTGRKKNQATGEKDVSSKKRISPSGKLYDHFYYVKGSMSKAKLLGKKSDLELKDSDLTHAG